MKLLLDTHVLLWWLDDDPVLSTSVRSRIADSRNTIFVSAATIWEIQIKKAIGKLSLPAEFRSVLGSQSFEMLNITSEHAFALEKLPMHHRDPFDRMLIAQAIVENLTLVTHDTQLKQYSVKIIQT